MMNQLPTIGRIVDFLQARDSLCKVKENALETPIARASEIMNAQAGDMAFCGPKAKNPRDLITNARASLVIVDQSIAIDRDSLALSEIQAVILSKNARLDFLRVLQQFFVPPRPKGIHPWAVIAASAIIGDDVFIGPFCTIQEEVQICEGTVIHAGAHIYDRVVIGRRVTIFSGTVIGKDGWGYERNAVGKLEKFPHLGSVEIGDDVELGANVVVDRATLGKTKIGSGCRINNGSHIGHNVEVGEDTIILPHGYLGGSSKVGARCWIGPKALVRNRVEIGSDVFIGMGSVVTKNVPDRMTVMGSPAREVEDQKKLMKFWSEIIAK